MATTRFVPYFLFPRVQRRKGPLGFAFVPRPAILNKPRGSRARLRDIPALYPDYTPLRIVFPARGVGAHRMPDRWARGRRKTVERRRATVYPNKTQALSDAIYWESVGKRVMYEEV